LINGFVIPSSSGADKLSLVLKTSFILIISFKSSNIFSFLVSSNVLGNLYFNSTNYLLIGLNQSKSNSS
jgi:hypothetical protein